MEILKIIGSIALALIILAAIVAGGQQGGFWLQHNQTEFESRNFRRSYANQERLREDLAEKIGTVLSIEAQVAGLNPSESDQAGPLEAQARAITNIACHDASQIQQGVPPELAEFTQQRCLYGAVAP